MGQGASRTLYRKVEVTETQWFPEHIVQAHSLHNSDIPLVPVEVSSETEDVHIYTYGMDVPIAPCKPTSDLKVVFTAVEEEKNFVLRVQGKSPRDIQQTITDMKKRYNNAFRVVHSVESRAWGMRSLHEYSFILQAEKQCFLLWAKIVSGIKKETMTNVPVLLVENTLRYHTYDVHALLPGTPVITNRNVQIHKLQSVASDNGGANEIIIVQQGRERIFTGVHDDYQSSPDTPTIEKQVLDHSSDDGDWDKTENVRI